MPTTFVLVPGAGGDPWFWHLVQEELDDRGIGSTAVDLPGPDAQLGLPHYVDLVGEALAGRDDVVLVGQSLGGFTAAWVAAEREVAGLVLLNAMIPLPGETAGQWWAATGSPAAKAELDRAHGRDADAPFDVDWTFLHDLPPALVEASADHALDEADVAFTTPFGPSTWTTAPTHVLVGADDRLFPADFQLRVARERLGIEADVVEGGHLAALSHPVGVVDALLNTLHREDPS